jgi:DNA-binding NarL/FixJ family response regulator
VKKNLRIVLADDHALVRAGFRALLQSLDGIEVVAEAENGAQALELIERHLPDLVLMDIAMPGLNGLEAAARAAKSAPEVKIIILSMHANEEYVLQSLKAGAKGYLLKDAGLAELQLALESVSSGQTFLSPAISKHLIDAYVERTSDGMEPFTLLTSRQREILQLIAEGATTKEIAQKLGVSVKTVETHRTQLMQRLDIHDLAGLVRYAIRLGITIP